MRGESTSLPEPKTGISGTGHLVKPELHHADPGVLFDVCATHVDHKIAPLHDDDGFYSPTVVRKAG